jgi:hypothetical protein
MLPGTSGMFGGGSYFAETRETARHKAARDGPGEAVLIEAEVDMGTALVTESPSPSLNFNEIRSRGCDSVKGRGSAKAHWEYVVYEPTRIRVLAAEGRLEFISPEPSSQSTSYITGQS